MDPDVGRRSTSATPGPAARPRKPSDKGKQKEVRSRTGTPRPTPPPIHMPDPGAPPPPNFLRNQQALLGLAGLVGGVDPANLNRSTAGSGSSSKNPIIVEEGHEPPSIAQHSRLPRIDPSQLPTPSTDAILDTMIKQKNIFPVLSSILKLISSAATPAAPYYNPYQYSYAHSPSPTPSAENDGPPPAKRKKVTKVPAGASNWDVPFPLDNDEGSQEYLARWERARTKQLVVQLVNLIKSAAHKAATKAYMQKVNQAQKDRSPAPPPSDPHVMGHYRPATMFYGMELEGQAPAAGSGAVAGAPTSPGETADLQAMLADVSNGNDAVRSTTQGSATDPSSTSDTISYDQLIASLLSAAPASTDSSAAETNTVPLESLPNASSTADEGSVDIEGWMSLLQSLPSVNSGVDSQGSSECSSASQGSHYTISNGAQTRLSSTPVASVSSSQSSSDLAIDPFLLALSQVTPSQPQGLPDASQLPVLSHSPVASVSSVAGPPTPPSWDAGTFTDSSGLTKPTGDDPMAAATMLLQLASEPSSQPSQQSAIQPSMQNIPSHIPQSTAGSQANLSSATPNTCGVVPYAPTYPSLANAAAPGPSSLPARRVGRPPVPSAKKIVKEDIILRSKERRRQLLAEIERAKIQLWETTLEQGVLTHLIKDSS